MAALSLKGVRKSYDGKQHVLHGIDVEIADGEFIVLVGPSGCGKSTLLRMIAGLETVTDGEIAIGERVVNTLEPKDRIQGRRHWGAPKPDPTISWAVDSSSA